jgi:hypothetical protein
LGLDSTPTATSATNKSWLNITAAIVELQRAQNRAGRIIEQQTLANVTSSWSGREDV